MRASSNESQVAASIRPERSAATAPLKNAPPPDYRKFLDAGALKGKRIGVVRKLAGFDDEVDAVFDPVDQGGEAVEGIWTGATAAMPHSG